MGWSTPWRATLAMPANSRAIQSGAALSTVTDAYVTNHITLLM